MTSLHQTDSESPGRNAETSDADTISGNAAFYRRLQGQTTKTGAERFGWVAIPVAAVAVIGIAAATSMLRHPTETAPVQTASTASPAVPATVPQATPDAAGGLTAESSPPAKTAHAGPHPIRLSHRSVTPSREPTAAPARAAPVQMVPAPAPEPVPVNPPAPVQSVPAPITEVNPSVAPAPAPSTDAAPAAPAPQAPAPQ